MNFGGFDWGNYSLINPKGIAAAPNNSIFAVDENSLIIFDNFGNGVFKTETEENFDDINIVFSKITLSNSRTIYTGDLKELSGDTGLKLMRAELIGEEGLEQIRSSFIFNQRLYVLMPAEINVYKIIQN
jgi:outer membrane lipoprotein-sorting protein